MLRPIVAILPVLVAAAVLGAPAAMTAQRNPTSTPATPPTSGAPLRMLLVDDDRSYNNNDPSDSRRTPSDIIYRRLVAEALGRDSSTMAIERVRPYGNGPTLERLRAFDVIVWYTGANYGGNDDNAAVLSVVDERAVRRYLEEVGGTVILISPGYVSKVLGANSTWEKATWPFLNEVLRIKGGKGLAQRFQPGTVVTPDGRQFTVGTGSAELESQFSAVNPDGATVVFTSALSARDIGNAPVPVATFADFGRGRIVYVGFTFENLDAANLAPAFQVLLAAGRPKAATVAAADPTTTTAGGNSAQPRSNTVDRAGPFPTVAPTIAPAAEPAGTPAATQAAKPAGVPLQSALLGLDLPDGTTLSKSGLYRAAARASLKLDAGPAGLKLGDPLEVWRIPLTAPPMAELVEMIRSAGWMVTMNQVNPTWGIAERGGVAVMVEFVDSKRDRWLYVAAIAERGVGPVVATNGGIPSAPQSMPQSAPQSAPETISAPGTPQSPGAIATPNQPVAPVPPAPTSGTRGGFQYTISDFSDGWTSTERPDHVEVTKGPVTTLLFFGVAMTDQMRLDPSDFFWARDVAPRFNVQSPVHVKDGRSVYRTEYLEGEGNDRRTGKRVFVGMNVFRDNGRARNVVVIAPDEAAFHQLFPQPDDLETMLPYNRFAVAAADLTGHWTSSGSVVAQMYFRSTGESAGMNINSSSTNFYINADGSYTSKHVGAFGMAGNTKVYSDTYKGMFTVNDGWEVTFTNRFNGNADTFESWFEVVTGGRVLHLVNKKATGIRYDLGREP